jgi:hypothetical protein
MKLDRADHAERYPQYNSNMNLWAYLASVPDDLTTCVQLRLKLISGAVLAADHCQPKDLFLWARDFSIADKVVQRAD